MRILFVDDEPRVLQGLRRLLFARRARWQALYAGSGAEALELLEAKAIDVVVTDVRMPSMTGIELLGLVRERFPQVVRVLLSGQVGQETSLRTVVVAHRFLSKPCNPDQLFAALEEVEDVRLRVGSAAARGMVGAISSLPSAPTVWTALRHRLADPAAGIEEVAEIVEHDVALSVKVLQLVNSSFLGLGHPVTSPAEGVAYLGLRSVRNLLESGDVAHAWDDEVRVPGFCVDTLSQRARARAEGVRANGAAPGGAAVTAALLQDVGQLALVACSAERFAANVVESLERGLPLQAVEACNDGFTHVDVGAYLLALWGVPSNVVQRVAGHRGGAVR